MLLTITLYPIEKGAEPEELLVEPAAAQEALAPLFEVLARHKGAVTVAFDCESGAEAQGVALLLGMVQGYVSPESEDDPREAVYAEFEVWVDEESVTAYMPYNENLSSGQRQAILACMLYPAEERDRDDQGFSR